MHRFQPHQDEMFFQVVRAFAAETELAFPTAHQKWLFLDQFVLKEANKSARYQLEINTIAHKFVNEILNKS